MSLLEVLQAARKDKNLGIDADTIHMTEDAVEYLSTGSIILDKILGRENCIGGVGRGRITEIYGLESSGKTTIALHLAKEVQKKGGNVAFVDFEAALDTVYAKKLGVDLDPNRFAHISPMTLEEGANIIDYLLENHKQSRIDCVIIDSIKAMTPKVILEGLATDEPPMAIQARKIGTFLTKLVKKIKDTKTAVILLNQMTKNIKSNPYQSGGEYETPGGLAPRFYASTRIQLKKLKTEYVKKLNPVTNTEEDMPDSNIVRANIIKNKIGIPYREAELVIKFGLGVDNKRSIIDMAVNHGIIQQGGAWYTYKENDGGFKLQGFDNVKKFFQEESNKHVLSEIANSLVFNQKEELKKEALQEELDAKKAVKTLLKKKKEDSNGQLPV